ncbi:MAG: FAD-binding protein [Vicinamibacteria bacterium]|nr:FAD-binding protein [Vicinamibacteria bacterium]
MTVFKTDHTFENWSDTIKFRPGLYGEPSTVVEIQQIVQQAANAGGKIRTQGAGHSFSQLLPTAGTLLSLDQLKLPIVENGAQVTVPGGIRLKDLIKELRKRGRGLRNLGSITEQSIAGATATGTHGTGLRLGAIHTQIAAMKLVDGQGQLRTIDGSGPKDLAAARLSLGALGIITEVTLETVPDYRLEYNAYLCRLDDVLGRIDQLNQENERMLFWWFLPPVGPRDCVILITKNPVGTPPGWLAAATDLPGMSALGGILRGRRLSVDTLLGVLGGALGHLAGAGPRRILHFVDDYDRVLTIPLLPVYHRECEYAIPAGRAWEALEGMRRVFDEGDVSLRLPVEVRFVAPDDALLSPSRDRASGVAYIGASTLENATEVFERFEPLMRGLEGRPHWGKNFTLRHADVEAMYPGSYSEFRAARASFDPKGVFSNSFLDELFG